MCVPLVFLYRVALDLLRYGAVLTQGSQSPIRGSGSPVLVGFCLQAGQLAVVCVCGISDLPFSGLLLVRDVALDLGLKLNLPQGFAPKPKWSPYQKQA